MSAICAVLGVGRATAYRASLGRPRRYAKADDPRVTMQLQHVVRERPSYGYRRVEFP
jgi:hypothetical protein